VFLYYDLCESIWAGSPATEQISSGLETTDVEQDHLPPTSEDDTSSIGESYWVISYKLKS